MKTNNIIILFVCSFLLNGCGVLFFKDEDLARKRYLQHQAQYEPYRLRNTVESYREFIQQHPRNLFIDTARAAIIRLEFDPYEEQNNIEGYMEFVLRYPDNPNVFKASTTIEQIEFKRYEQKDSISSYRAFLEKYPNGVFAVLAQNRLQELEFRALARELKKKYGFDLLLYRLAAKRIKKKLAAKSQGKTADFTLFAAMKEQKGKRYFHTQLIYSALPGSAPPAKNPFIDAVGENVISPLLLHLNQRFTRLQDLDGFSFETAASSDGYYGNCESFIRYTFSTDVLKGHDLRTLSKAQILEQGLISTSTFKAAVKQPLAVQTAQPLLDPATIPKDADAIMTRVTRRDRGHDAIMSHTWERTRPNGQKNIMKTMIKQLNRCRNKNIVSKSLIRYIEPRMYIYEYAAAMLVINYAAQRTDYWVIGRRGDPGRRPDPQNYRPPPESDFNFSDYLDVNLTNEKHILIGIDSDKSTTSAVIESSSLNKHLPYTKRISHIDCTNWAPTHIDYYDETGNLWKKLTLEWQRKQGIWSLAHAHMENIQTGVTTDIHLKDIRIDVGLTNKDVTRNALRRMAK
ncbi:MAG: outer membrane lipoprotein-sorting protein [Deltaproteobacteria bacterium]|nr:outer membrane lipoprotein-sorting protein [Deltaproteobacteria bacterium]